MSDTVAVFDILHKAFNWEEWLESATKEWMKRNPDSFVSAIEKMDQRWLYRLERTSSYDILEYEIRNRKGAAARIAKSQQEAALRVLAIQRDWELNNLGMKMTRANCPFSSSVGWISLRINIYRDWSEVTLDQISVGTRQPGDPGGPVPMAH